MPDRMKEQLVLELLQDSLTKKEILKSFEAIVRQIVALEKALLKNHADSMTAMENKIESDFDSIKRGEQNEFSDLQKEVEKTTSQHFKEITTALKYVREKAESLKDGVDGVSPTREEVAALITELIPEQKELTPEATRDKLETLKDDERLDKTAIKGIEELEKKIDEKPVGGGGRVGWGAHPLTIQSSGTVIDKVTRFLNFTGATVTRSLTGVVTVGISGSGFTELTATGTINGVNTAFTFTEQPDYIVADGAWYKVNAGWTWADPTATLSIPPTSSIFGVT